ncbi:MAG: outer membrane beta-barrel protein [Acidobacteriota bacterium]|nr:outer membrane beta-barrel protein [Acidobacteriota bacterium]
MRRLTFIVCLTLCTAPWSLAQTPNEYPKNEFFAGYSFNSADINTLTVDPSRTGQNGVNLEYTRNLSPIFGITGDISAHFKRSSRQTGAELFESKRDQYYLLGGIQLASRKGKRIAPFVHALFGVSLFRGFTSSTTPSGRVFTFDDATSFAMAFGGGLDVRLNHRVAIRLFQADYAPTFFGSGRQDNVRLSVGIVFK